MTLLMVVIGGITRLTQSGLSITEWQPIDGILPPLSDADWQAAFERYQQIPQYRQQNAGMTLEEFRGIFFWEYLHRLIGRLTGLVALLPPIFLMVSGRVHASQLPRLILVPVLVLLQGLLGWYMVESGLAVRTSVSQYRLAAHLTLALTLYSYCVWQAATLLDKSVGRLPATARSLRWAAGGILVLVSLTIAAGAFTAGTHAGLVYNTFPLMDGHLVPSGYWQLHPWWLNPFENVTAVQFDHRLLATLTFGSIVAFWVYARMRGLDLADLLLAAVVVQVTLGIATLLLSVPILLAAAHQTMAVLLLTAALLTLHRLSHYDPRGGRASFRT
jgi:cytochrome c oxidase assembly protein subunit 15